MLNIYICTVTAIIFAFCTAVVIHQAAFSMYFRKKIAPYHGFFEGIMTGMAYPLLWIAYSLTAVQFLSFIAFPTDSELILTVRLIFFALSILAFCIFKTLTPPLLAYWFGKHAFWDAKGELGKRSYSDIYCAKVHKDKNSSVINSQQIYKITFYVKGKTFFLIPKRYSCKMTAKEISQLSTQVNLKDRTAKPEVPQKAVLYAICMPILIFAITLCTFFQTVSTGIFNADKYTSTEQPSDSPIVTVTEISEVMTDGERVYVYYEKVGALNVYSVNGDFLYTVSLPDSFFRHSSIALNGSNAVFRLGNTVYRYSSDGALTDTSKYSLELDPIFNADNSVFGQTSVSNDGKSVKAEVNGASTLIVAQPSYASVFSAQFMWSVNMLLIVALFALRYFVMKPGKASDASPLTA